MSKPFSTRSYAFTEQGEALNWIGGAFVPAIGGGTLAVENPRHAKVMGRVAMSGPGDVTSPAAAARTSPVGASPLGASAADVASADLAKKAMAIENDEDAAAWAAAAAAK